jgi:hypothetical protein
MVTPQPTLASTGTQATARSVANGDVTVSQAGTTVKPSARASGGYQPALSTGLESDAGNPIFKMQPWITLCGSSSSAVVTQPPEGWLDGSTGQSFLFSVEVLGVSGCTLCLETAMGGEGPWNAVLTMTAATVLTNLVTPEGGGSDPSKLAYVARVCYWEEQGACWIPLGRLPVDLAEGERLISLPLDRLKNRFPWHIRLDVERLDTSPGVPSPGGIGFPLAWVGPRIVATK